MRSILVLIATIGVLMVASCNLFVNEKPIVDPVCQATVLRNTTESYHLEFKINPNVATQEPVRGTILYQFNDWESEDDKYFSVYPTEDVSGSYDSSTASVNGPSYIVAFYPGDVSAFIHEDGFVGVDEIHEIEEVEVLSAGSCPSQTLSRP